MRIFTSLLLAALVAGTVSVKAQDTRRRSVMTGARNLTVTTTDGNSYYYFVSSQNIVKVVPGQQIAIGPDTYDVSKIQEIRLKNLPRFLLDGSAAEYDRNASVDHGLLGFRRKLNLGKWNTLQLPVDLTGEQIKSAFGSDTRLARLEAARSDAQGIIDFTTVDLKDDSVVIVSGDFYLISPSKVPDVGENGRINEFAETAVTGPIYLIPNVNLATGQFSRTHYYRNEDKTTSVRAGGSYVVRDGSTRTNRKLDPGVYVIGDSGKFVQVNDSATISAFSFWLTDRSDEAVPLTFYVDGVSEELTTGISSIEAGDATVVGREADGNVYDLSGRRVNAANLPKGIYIRNGKKFIVK